MQIPDKAMTAAFQAATGGAELHLDDRMYWEQIARDVLEAAAPFIAAQALRDAAEDCNCGDDADLLDAKADASEGPQ